MNSPSVVLCLLGYSRLNASGRRPNLKAQFFERGNIVYAFDEEGAPWSGDSEHIPSDVLFRKVEAPADWQPAKSA